MRIILADVPVRWEPTASQNMDTSECSMMLMGTGGASVQSEIKRAALLSVFSEGASIAGMDVVSGSSVGGLRWLHPWREVGRGMA